MNQSRLRDGIRKPTVSTVGRRVETEESPGDGTNLVNITL